MSTRHFRGISFKLGATILLVQAAALSAMGYYYTLAFARRIDHQTELGLQRPAALLAQGVLGAEVVTDARLLRELVGEDVTEALVLDLEGRVTQASNPRDVGRLAWELAALSPDELRSLPRGGRMKRNEKDGELFFVSLVPVQPSPTLSSRAYVYLETRSVEARQAKAAATGRFISGSLATLLATSGVLFFLISHQVVRRLRRILSVVTEVKQGQLASRTQLRPSRDELGDLQAGVDTMAARLQGTIERLQEQIRQVENSRATIREKEIFLQRLFEGAPEALFLLDDSGQITQVNQQGCRLLGTSLEHLLQRSFWEVDVSLGKVERFNELRTQLESASSMSREGRFRRDDGSEFPVEFQLSALTTGQGAFFLVFARDVTQRKQLETVARETQAMLRLVVDTVPVRLFWKDRDRRYLGCNQAFAADAGVDSPEEVIGKDDYAFSWQEQAEAYRADDQEVMDSGRPKLNYEEPQTWPDGTRLWLRTSKLPLRDSQREVIGLLGCYEDITEHKREEAATLARVRLAALQAEIGQELAREKPLSQLAQQCADAIARHLPETQVRLWLVKPGESDLTLTAQAGPRNADQPVTIALADGEGAAGAVAKQGQPWVARPAASVERLSEEGWIVSPDRAAYAGYPLMLGTRLFGVLEAAHPGGFDEPLLEALELLANRLALGIQRNRVEQDVRALNTQLETRVQERTAELQERVDEVEQLNHGMINLLEDLQQAQQTAERDAVQLQRLNAELDALNRELEAFGDSVAHDLQSPLDHLAGLLHEVEASADGLGDDARRQLETAVRETQQIGGLIQNLQRLSEISRAPLHLERVEMRRLVDEARAGLKGETQAREIQWQVDPLPKVRGDPSLLAIVWVNLLGNALKYTRSRPQATIHTGCDPDPQDPQRVIFFVRDNGVGFDMKQADRLFAVFQALPGTSEFEGTGIGLATVQRIIRRHGGKVWAEAEPEAGATFYFSLPYLDR